MHSVSVQHSHTSLSIRTLRVVWCIQTENLLRGLGQVHRAGVGVAECFEASSSKQQDTEVTIFIYVIMSVPELNSQVKCN